MLVLAERPPWSQHRTLPTRVLGESRSQAIERRVPRRRGNRLFDPGMVLRDHMDLGHEEIKAVPRDVSHPNMFPGLSGASVAVAVSRPELEVRGWGSWGILRSRTSARRR